MERTKLALIAVVLATIGALSALDLFLAKTEDRETSAEARHDFESGLRLMKEHRAADAVEQFRRAHTLDRSDQRYSLELAAALLTAGKFDEAHTMLADILQISPNNGEANLLEARLLVPQNKIAEASSYYHRAIYGIWPANAPRHRVQVRLELADLLAAHGSSQELLAELLPLETEAGSDLAVRKQVAHLFLLAGSPIRAAAAYRALIHTDPGDLSNQAGLGEAELAQGHYRAAATAFQNAGAADRAQLATGITALDPTPRGLNTGEKLARSVLVLQLSRDALTRCSANDDLIAEANAIDAKKIRTPTNELAEERLTLAEQLWQQRLTRCGDSTSLDEEPLRLLMAKLSGR
jgi:tetratricopeptide (TPR) repeat protein